MVDFNVRTVSEKDIFVKEHALKKAFGIVFKKISIDWTILELIQK